MIYSMTAYSRQSDENNFGSMTWEIRSVNHRFLDYQFHLPEPFRHLETELRKILSSKVTRGRVECSLKFKPGKSIKQEISLNTSLVKALISATEEIKKISKEPISNINPIGLLSWEHVLQINEKSPVAIDKKIIALFVTVLNQFLAAKKQEGGALAKIVLQQLDMVKTEVSKASKILPDIIKKHREKIREHFKDLQLELEQERLEQEMVLYTQKIDITEELDRLTTHVVEVKRVIDNGGAVGKRLDFLMQELNREANTLGAKSADIVTTRASVELKVLIEKMREQIQNIE